MLIDHQILRQVWLLLYNNLVHHLIHLVYVMMMPYVIMQYDDLMNLNHPIVMNVINHKLLMHNVHFYQYLVNVKIILIMLYILVILMIDQKYLLQFYGHLVNLLMHVKNHLILNKHQQQLNVQNHLYDNLLYIHYINNDVHNLMIFFNWKKRKLEEKKIPHYNSFHSIGLYNLTIYTVQYHLNVDELLINLNMLQLAYLMNLILQQYLIVHDKIQVILWMDGWIEWRG